MTIQTTVQSTLKSAVFVAVAVFSASGSPLQAQDGDVSSVLSGVVGGTEREWVIQNKPPHASTVFSSLGPGVHHFTITGYASEDHGLAGSIALEFTFSDGQARSPEVRFYPFAQRHPRFSFGDDHGTGELVVERAEVDALSARLSGYFEGELYYHQSPNTDPIVQRTKNARIEFNLTANRD